MDLFTNGKSLSDIVESHLFMSLQRTLGPNDNLNSNLKSGIYKTTNQLPQNCDPSLTWGFIIIMPYDDNTILQIGLKADLNNFFLKGRYFSFTQQSASDWRNI